MCRRWSLPLLSLEKPTHKFHQCLSLLLPGMCQIDFLASLSDFDCLAGMGIDIFNLCRQFLCVACFEEQKRLGIEVVLNPRCPRGNYWFAQGQIFEDPSWRIDVGKPVALIWNNPDI